MDSSVLAKDEIWFLRVCHHISTGLYADSYHWRLAQQVTSLQLNMNQLTSAVISASEREHHLSSACYCSSARASSVRCVTGHSKAASAWTARGFRLPPLCTHKRYSFVWDVNAALIGSSSLRFRHTLLLLSSGAELLDG
jgi:hypothetical protein